MLKGSVLHLENWRLMILPKYTRKTPPHYNLGWRIFSDVIWRNQLLQIHWGSHRVLTPCWCFYTSGVSDVCFTSEILYCTVIFLYSIGICKGSNICKISHTVPCIKHAVITHHLPCWTLHIIYINHWMPKYSNGTGILASDCNCALPYVLLVTVYYTYYYCIIYVHPLCI